MTRRSDTGAFDQPPFQPTKKVVSRIATQVENDGPGFAELFEHRIYVSDLEPSQISIADIASQHAKNLAFVGRKAG